jgi:hypothetical protein
VANIRPSRRAARFLGLAVLVPALLAVAQPVAAATPVMDRFVLQQDPWLNDGLTGECGFPVWEFGSDTFSITTFLNNDGSLRQVVLHDRGAWTETNLTTGVTASQTYDRTYLHAFSGTPTVVGSADKVRSGGGVVLLDAGLLTWEFADGEVLTMAGPHPSFLYGTDWCGILGA